ncbi:hypothetical protein J4Q44_G00082620 [Coregonus suidteri]|uniref:Uncharacterized protein n=1 Tax=Coregonus suidteri TaxID=861788 RepID=A0AAN8N1T9_9TELE
MLFLLPSCTVNIPAAPFSRQVQGHLSCPPASPVVSESPTRGRSVVFISAGVAHQHFDAWVEDCIGPKSVGLLIIREQIRLSE